MGSLQKVGGNASFRYTTLNDLGCLEYVGGDLSLRDTKINDLGKLCHVGGNLYLPMRLKGKLDLSSITIGGQVRYWNDVKNTELSTISEDGQIGLVKSDIPVPYWPHTYIYPSHDMSQEPMDVQQYYVHFKKSFDHGILYDTEGYSNYSFMLVFDLQKRYEDPSLLAEKYDVLTKGYPKLRGYCDDILVDLYKSHQDV